MSEKGTFIEPSVIKANPVKEVTLDILWEDKPAKVVLKRLTYGERNEVMRQAMGGKIRYQNEESATIEVDPFLMREMLLAKSIKEAPFPNTIEGVKSLDPDIAEALLIKSEEINPFRSII